jgi:3-oxoacyl-[acyl-carrier-protein] synthase II
VVITGCGVVSAAGNDPDSFWQGLVKGRCLIEPLRHYALPDMPTLYGAEVVLAADDGLRKSVDAHPTRSRCLQLALAAARRAIQHAGLREADLADAGVVVGTTMGEERQVGYVSEAWASQGPNAIAADFHVRADNHRLASSIAERFDLGGPVMVNATACSSGNAAQAWAYDLVANGEAEVMLAGAADTFTRLLFNGFGRMGALAKTVCRPFHRSRDGVAFGEGAALLVLESLDHARARGAHVLAEVAGYGMSNDAHHVTAPDPSGAGYARALSQARAQLGSTPVGFICAHGTGTPYNDASEVRAIKTVFAEQATRIPVSSPKSIIGHTNGAAGALASVACTLALIHQIVPPTANLDDPDPEFGLDFVTGQGRATDVPACLNMSAGFGGFNVCMALRRAP